MIINDDLLKLEGALTLGFTTSISNQTANFTLTNAQIDKVSVVKIIQTTPSVSCTAIAAPTSTTAGRLLLVINDSTSTAAVTILGIRLNIGDACLLIYNGSTWSKLISKEANIVTKTCSVSTAIADSFISLGELEMRYTLNAIAGNLEVRSSSAATIPIHWSGFERYPSPATQILYGGSLTGLTILNANTGLYTVLTTGGAGYNEIEKVFITTQTNCYEVEFRIFNNGQLHIKAEKWN